MKKILTVLISCLFATLANAVTLSGNIKTEAMKVLPFASVYVKDAHMGATSDLSGNYIIKGLPAGHIVLVVSYMGYQTQTIELTLEKDEVRDFVMHEQAITLNEIFVTPSGESIERFILSQTVKNTKFLSDCFTGLNCDEVYRIEQRNNNMKVAVEPFMKILNFALGILGYKGFFHALMNHPDLKVEMVGKLKLQKGNIRNEDVYVSSSTPQLNDEESKSMTKVFSKRTNIPYDDTYKELAKLKKTLEKADKKNKDESEKLLTYEGAYKENGKTIHIIKAGRAQYHIVDGCWKVRRYVSKKNNGEASYLLEYQELANNAYLPVAYYKEGNLGTEKLLKEELDGLKKEDTSKMKSKKLAEHNARIEALENALKKDVSTYKVSCAFNYSNFVAK